MSPIPLPRYIVCAIKTACATIPPGLDGLRMCMRRMEWYLFLLCGGGGGGGGDIAGG